MGYSRYSIRNEALPFYQEKKLAVGAILTDNGREFCGRETHPYELYLALNDIEHRRTKVRNPKTNGFVERFNLTALDEFFRIVFREKFYETVEALQEDLDTWLVDYNTERPHLGYRNKAGEGTPLRKLLALVSMSCYFILFLVPVGLIFWAELVSLGDNLPSGNR